MSDILDYLEKRAQVLRGKLGGLDQKRQLLEMEMADLAELLRATEAVLEAERDARGLKDSEEMSWAKIKSKLRTMTLKDAVWTIVSAQGERGIHADDILKALQDAGFPLRAQEPKRSIVGTIYHDINNYGTYEKIAPNTFRATRGATMAVQNALLEIQKS